MLVTSQVAVIYILWFVMAFGLAALMLKLSS